MKLEDLPLTEEAREKGQVVGLFIGDVQNRSTLETNWLLGLQGVARRMGSNCLMVWDFLLGR